MKFTLGSKVTHASLSLKGRVTGYWVSMNSPARYLVEYEDSTGRPGEYWCFEDDLTTA